MNVISFIDDCGHTVVIDVSTPKQALKVYAGLLKHAIDDRAIHYKDLGEAAVLHAKCTKPGADVDLVDDILELLDNADICLGGRDGLSPIEPLSEWPANTCLN